jgi:membrane-associated phospholipid phosphatase
MTGEAAFRTWLLALALCAMAVGLCILCLDRPLAEFIDAHVRHTEFWMWLDLALRPFALVVVAALFFLFGCGVWSISGRQLRPWTEIPFFCSLSAIWAVGAEIILKRLLGRGWPDPTFVQDHLYGFHLLHGEAHWEAFPSGTAAVSTAILAVLWILKPRSRAGGLVIVIFLSAGVVVGNYHWLSDVIAGAFLGVSIGWATVRLFYPFNRFTSDGYGSE